MKSTTYTIAAVLLAFAAASVANPASAKEDALEFIHLMQKEGFADIAVDYLDQLKSDRNAPPEVLRVWDMEMSRSKQAKAKMSYNDAEKKALLDESKALMEKFVKENPSLPEAVRAAAEWSTDLAIQAQNDVHRALTMTDKAERSATLAKARKTFEEIRPKFVQARDAAAKVRSSLRATASPHQKQEAATQLGEDRLRLAMVDFYLALTREDSGERAAMFKKVAKEFEDIYREYNEGIDTVVAYQAHYWNARILQEQGRFAEARDYYEEVQANDEKDVPDSTAGTKPGAAPRAQRKVDPRTEDYFFSGVERQFLKVLYEVARNDYFTEVEDWRKAHKLARESCPEYQGLSLDYARNLIAAGNQAKDDAKKQAMNRAAARILGEMKPISSPYQRDAAELMREIDPRAAAGGGFDDLMINAGRAVDERNWASAADLYGKAIAAATPKTDKERLAEARNKYMGCIHYQARDLYQKNKVDEAVSVITAALKTAEIRQVPTAPIAATDALAWRFYQYNNAPEQTDEQKKTKAALMAKTSDLARAIINVREWTAKEEADSARLVLFRLALIKSTLAEARAAEAKRRPADAKTAAEAKAADDEAKACVVEAGRIFNEINPHSRKYAEALTMLGKKHWYNYRVAKKDWEDKNSKAAPDKATQDQWDDDRKQAVDYIKKAVEDLDSPRSKGTPMPQELRDAKVLQAEMFVEGGDAKGAVGVYQALVDDILADPNTKSLDETTLRVFSGAVQAFLQLGDVGRASAVGLKLLELGPDDVACNTAIINFAKRLEIARKQAVGEGDSGNVAAQTALAELESKIMINLAKRDNLATKRLLPSTMVWIVQVLSKLGSDDADVAAAKLVDKIFDLANNDTEFDKEIVKAKAFLRTVAANILARQGDYDGAIKQVGALIDQYPNSLAPQMSRAQILTQWAAKDASKYAAAVKAWKILCVKLERTKTKSGEKMPEYYEAAYQRSLCLLRIFEKNKDKAAAREGLDFLTPILGFDPKLQGPSRDREWTAKFYQLAGKLADALGEPRPTPPSIRPVTKK